VKKTLFIFILLIAFGLLGWQVYQKIFSIEKTGPRFRRNVSVAVETEPVRKETIRDMGLFTGTLYPLSQFIVAPKISGRLEKLQVNVGDSINPNQLIAVLDQGEYAQQIDQARAELEVARANLEESKSNLDIAARELERAKSLRQKKIASESELDETAAQFQAQTARNKVAQAQLAQKAAALKAAEVRLSYTRIYSRVNGSNEQHWVVGERFVHEGDLLAPNTSIVSILDIGTLLAVIHIIEKDYPKVQVGQSATVTADAYPGKNFSGKIVRLAPLLKETSRQARAEIYISNPDTILKPGMFVRAMIEFDRHENATVIPVSSLVNREGRQGVFLADPKQMKVTFVPVTVGLVSGNLAEIIDPLVTGSIVTTGQHLLEDGGSIILPGSESSPIQRKRPDKPDPSQSKEQS